MSEPKTFVRFIDGAASIGGTKLLLQDEDVRLLFDFGINSPA